MKRPIGSSDSFSGGGSALDVYAAGEFRSMMEGMEEEELGCAEESGGHGGGEKKRRLAVHQVKALEKHFEVENKLEPERKVKLAMELGLQPRQVAIWFQNRRARWKTKQMERDYGVLKANYDSLKHQFESLQNDNEDLLEQIRELKEELNVEEGERKVSVKEEAIESVGDEQWAHHSNPPAISTADETGLQFHHFHDAGAASIFSEFKDWSSDSDSSAILNEENSPNATVSPAFMAPPPSYRSTASFPFSEIPRTILPDSYDSCTILLADEKAPTLQWCCPEDWDWEDDT
ncbi:unnamed protein product [Cuscuta campestris]|uniref:Homeobox-leucine zipper protein n=2 Tax=Cuscuta sect. Cleistogrammica TaxID=1824901 RepID=A0A484MX29_9ASTE|nr:hypothetical protein DM860_016291 [Cuscuta australis]VFQ93585.1 unnamed protein product [Cuscuta campestris]